MGGGGTAKIWHSAPCVWTTREHLRTLLSCPLIPADTVFREDFTFGTIGPNNIISGLAHLCPMVAHFSRPILRDSDDSEYWMRGIIGNGISRGGGLRTNALLEGGGQRTPTPCLPILGLDCFLQRPTFLPFHFSAVYLFAFSAVCLFSFFCLPTFGVTTLLVNLLLVAMFRPHQLRCINEWKIILAACCKATYSHYLYVWPMLNV